MKRHLGRIVVLILVGLFALAAAILRTAWAGDRVCAQARERLPKLLGMEVALGQCRVDPLRAQVEIRGFSITPPKASEPLFAADRLQVRLGVWGSLGLGDTSLQLERVEAERPRVRADLRELDLGKGGAGCFLDSLKKIEIDNFSVSGGELHIVAEGGRSLDFDEVDLDLRMNHKTYSAQLDVPRGQVGTGQVELPLARLKVSAALDLAHKKLTVNRLEVATGELAAFVRGDVLNVCDPTFNLEASLYLPLDLVSKILGAAAPPMSGSAAVNVKKLEGSLSDPSAEVELTLAHARVGPFEPGDAFLEARLDKGEVRIDKLDIDVGDGKVHVVGKVGLGKGLPTVATVDFENLPFGKLLDKLTVHHAWVDYRATGRDEVKGQLMPLHLAGPASVDVRDFHVYDRGWDQPDQLHVMEFDQAHVELMTDYNLERVRLYRAKVRTPRGSEVDADVALNYDPSKGFLIDADPHEADLADLKHIVGIPWDGKLAGRCSIKIINGEPRIDGQATIRDFRFHKVALGTTEAQIQLRKSVLGFPVVTVLKGRSRIQAEGELDLTGPPRVRATGSFDGARLADLLDAVGDEARVFDPLRGHADARATGTASVEGPVLRTNARVEMKLEDLTWLERKLGDGRLVFRDEDGERLYLDPVEVDGPCGKFRFAGQVDFEKGIDFTFDAPSLVLSEAAKPKGDFLQARGTLSTRLRFHGAFDHVVADGVVLARDVALFGVVLGGGKLDFKFDHGTGSLKGPVGKDLLVDARVVFEGDLPFAVGVNAATTDLGHYFPSVPGLRGALTGEALATGTITKIEEARGDIWIPKVMAGKGDLSLSNDGPLAFSFHGSAVELKEATIKGPAGTLLTVSGTLDEELDAQVDGSFDARLIELVTPEVEKMGGAFKISAHVTGPPSQPTMVGEGSLEDGRFEARDYPVSARNVNGEFGFSQNVVSFAKVLGTVNGGAFELDGQVELKDFAPSHLSLSAVLDSVPFRWPETVPTAFSGMLTLAGPVSRLLLAGQLDLISLRYTEQVDLVSFFGKLKSQKLEAKSFEKRDEWLRYDVRVHVPGNGIARIDNNVAKANLVGDLTLTGTNVHMGLTGTINAEDGSRGFFRDNEFTVSHAALSFTKTDRIAAILDVHAEAHVQTQTETYTVTLFVSGPVEEPEVQLTSDPSLARGDILSLLTIGVPASEKNTLSTMTGMSLVGEAVMNMSGLDKQIKKFLPKNAVLNNLNVHISTQYQEGSGTVEPTAQLEANFLTSDLKLRLSQPVISGRGRRVQMEGRVSDHVGVQLQWDDEAASGNSGGDLGVDVKLRWEFP